jgi:2-oxoglutarate dehydrogenase E2 component (dihydrolipoamide succinyltransferase)
MDFEGSNFSVINPGTCGFIFGTPVINYPKAAVFNMNHIQYFFMAIDGTS